MSTTLEEQKAGIEWANKFHSHGDAFEFERYVYDFYTSDGELNLGPNPTVKGQDNILDVMRGMSQGLDSMRHVPTHVDVTRDRIYQEVTVYYKVKGDPSGEEIGVPALAVFHKTPENDRMTRLDVYGNFEVLMARMQQVMQGGGA